MFRVQPTDTVKHSRTAMIGLLVLSGLALAITIWVMIDLLDEQRIVQQLIRDLPARDLPAAETLAGELRWQFRLSILVVINLIAAGIAVALLWRAYNTTQASLRDIKALAGDILSSMDQAVFTIDLDATISSFNSRAVELLELGGDPVGTPLAELSDQIDLVAFREKANASDSTVTIEDFFVQSSSGLRCLRTFCQPLRNYGNEMIGNVIQFRDVTELIHVENQMRRMERFMGLGSLAAGLHHEIKNPLAALSLHVQLLEEQLDDPSDPDEIQQMLRVIKTEVTRVGSVLEGFRDFASVGRLRHDTVELSELIDQQVNLIGPRAKQLGVTLDVRRTCAAGPIVMDRVRIEQVLLNLMLNALQVMPGGGSLTFRCAPAELNGKNAIRLAVTDTGNGIPSAVQSHVFDPYFTTKNEGTGMGLALSDKIVRQHGGRLDFDTSEKGTTFFFDLPIDAVALDSTERLPATTPSDPFETGT